jgi:CRP-like cAMP-binding protein
MDTVLKQLAALFSESNEMYIKYASCYHKINVPAKTVLLKEGHVSKKAYLIEKGCIRTWFNNNGREVSFQFFFEREGVSSIESFRKKIPSLYTIETVEPCILYWIHKKDLDIIFEDLSGEDHINNRFMNIMLERQFNYMRQFMSFIRDSPKQRYLNLLKDKAHIIQRVPQQYIASYLGITPVSLSRIRNAVKH